jgi:hypothetical protein
MSLLQSRDYRFGFNGQEKVDEIAGIGNHNTALFWEYDTRLGRRWNLDPRPNSSISNYATFANNPIRFSDINGDSILLMIWTPENGNVGHSAIAIQNYKAVTKMVRENGKMVSKTTMEPDGTYTVMDFWPSEKTSFFTKKKDNGSGGYNPQGDKKFTLDELKNKFLTDPLQENKPADGILMIPTTYEKDQEITVKQLLLELHNSEYNAFDNNCTDYIEPALENATGKQLNAQETVYGKNVTMPIKLYNETKKQKDVKIIRDAKDKAKKSTQEQL